ncbi:glycosyltransferase [Sphingomonas gei]|uniref:Glycosyltransferase n=1 Tax=Sphingomonas gei TaxID=1395960 RepID=A0A4S1X0C2_9SPHN|nr:glycosyltransferase [Sphingomonas gei]TGX48665.1 glycosyltransferase [Sphingomonas gei]
MGLLFATLGSLGDVKPMVAIAAFARDAGHHVRFATSPGHRRLVEEAGLRYEAFGSDAFFESRDVRDAMVAPRTGFGVFMWHANLVALEELHGRLTEISEGADMLVATPLVMAAHLVAKQRKLLFVSCVFSPAMVLREASAGAVDPYQDEWRRRLNALRQEAGLPRRSFPQMERFSADLTLGVYPPCLRPASGHYISAPLEIGYPRLQMPLAPLDRGLATWMAKGDFALVSFGSFVDRDAENCFASAVEACQRVGLRCLYVSKHSANNLALATGGDVRVERFVEHSQVMPSAAAIVHHGGTGTLVESIHALRPIVVTPFGLDQTYNASRVQEHDLGEVLNASLIDPNTLAGALSSAISAWPRREALALSAIVCDQPEETAVREIEQILNAHRN